MKKTPERIVFGENGEHEIFTPDGEQLRWLLAKAGHRVFPGQMEGWMVTASREPKAFTTSRGTADLVLAAYRSAGYQGSTGLEPMGAPEST